MAYRTIVTRIESASPYSSSKHIARKMTAEDGTNVQFEERMWRERAHAKPDGEMYIPANCFTGMAHGAAKRLGMKVAGKRNATYTKLFESAVYCGTDLLLGVKKADVEGEWLFVPSDGKPGGGSRVLKCFPLVHEWSGELHWQVMKEEITEEILLAHLEEGGLFVGVGRWRPQNRGMYGRFTVASMKTVEQARRTARAS